MLLLVQTVLRAPLHQQQPLATVPTVWLAISVLLVNPSVLPVQQARLVQSRVDLAHCVHPAPTPMLQPLPVLLVQWARYQESVLRLVEPVLEARTLLVPLALCAMLAHSIPLESGLVKHAPMARTVLLEPVSAVIVVREPTHRVVNQVVPRVLLVRLVAPRQPRVVHAQLAALVVLEPLRVLNAQQVDLKMDSELLAPCVLLDLPVPWETPVAQLVYLAPLHLPRAVHLVLLVQQAPLLLSHKQRVAPIVVLDLPVHLAVLSAVAVLVAHPPMD